MIGIDGGATRTRARLASRQGETLGDGEAGASNPQAHGFAAAQDEILAAIQRAFDDAHVERQKVAAACFGISGADRPAERAEFTAWGQRHVAPQIAVVSDAEIILAAGSPEGWGIALVAGTGSMAWGKSRDGKVVRAGGWGYLIGDEGSGFDLAREALRASVQAADGRGEETHLLRALLAEWGLQEPMELVARVYRSGLKPADLARLTPVVIRVAEEGDAVAQRLLQNAADALATAVIAVARRLDVRDAETPLAMTGGVLLETDAIRGRLLEITHARGYHFKPELVRAPVAGAVRIAIERIIHTPNRPQFDSALN